MSSEQAGVPRGQEAGRAEGATDGQEDRKDDGAMTSWQPGDRVALVRTDDPDTRLRPGDQGTVTRWHPDQNQLDVRWDSGSTLTMLPGEGDQVRLITRAAAGDGTEPEDPGEPAPDWRQDISDSATGLSRMLSEKCGTCILRPGDPMHLGPERTAAFIRQVLDAGSYVVCHDTLTYGDFPGYGPAICRGFFDSYRSRSRALLILQAGRRLTEVPPPLIAEAEDLGRAAGTAAVPRAVDGVITSDDAWHRVMLGINEGDRAILEALEPPAIGPAAGYTEADLARDLGISQDDPGLPRAAEAYAAAFTTGFGQEADRTAREHDPG
jgi:hypothetical protein